MAISSANKVGEIVVNDIPAKYECSQILFDLLKNDLSKIATVNIPSGTTLGFIAASQNPPDEGEAKLWVELSGTGVPVSIRYFVDGSWKPLVHMLRSPQWFNLDYLSNKDNLEAQGFVLADGSNGGTDISHLFVRSGTGTPINYSTFAAYFVGRQILPNP